MFPLCYNHLLALSIAGHSDDVTTRKWTLRTLAATIVSKSFGTMAKVPWWKLDHSPIKNRRQMWKARQALMALPPEQREESRFNGVGPGEGYVAVWRMTNNYRHKIMGVQSQLVRGKKITKEIRRRLESDERYYSEQVASDVRSWENRSFELGHIGS
jgi:hypothetical protein